MNTPKSLIFSEFEALSNPLVAIKNRLNSSQSQYLFRYLKHLGARTVLVESNYFDRDFLDEFSAFYCLSAKGYPNVCKRLHFFSEVNINRETFQLALGDSEQEKELFTSSYLGFIVIRPITDSPFGRTVLKWYPDHSPNTPRVTNPSRKYNCNVAGIKLSVMGLAWQQQDSGVAACATIGIWTMLHSSAFNDRNAVPTTSMITEAAHSSALVGRPPYPSHFLQVTQIQHAIIQLGFVPAVTNGNLPGQFFEKERFASTCAAYIRSGYPLIIGAIHADGVNVGHAVCAVGFREVSAASQDSSKEVCIQDEDVEYVYIHDDNIGPNVRFMIESQDYQAANGQTYRRCVLKMKTPEYISDADGQSLDNTTLIPQSIIGAVHRDLKITTDSFFRYGIELTTAIKKGLNAFLSQVGVSVVINSLVFSTRFIMLKDFLASELSRQLKGEPALLSNIRMQLQENVPPMSLHLAVLRIALPDASVLLDVLFDTTDTDKNRSVFCHIIYDASIKQFLDILAQETRTKSLGVPIIGF